MNSGDLPPYMDSEIIMSPCHCGKDGHALNSVNCPVHGYEVVPKSLRAPATPTVDFIADRLQGCSAALTPSDAKVLAAVAARTMTADISKKAREWAEHYPIGSDGRNTFILFAEWVEGLSLPQAGQSSQTVSQTVHQGTPKV